MNLANVWKIVWQDTPFHWAIAIILFVGIAYEICTLFKYFYLECGETANGIKYLTKLKKLPQDKKAKPSKQLYSWLKNYLQPNNRGGYLQNENKFILKKYPIVLLQEDGSDITEVCIFDFGEWLVVEFFRGRGSETRLFPNNHRNQQVLFGNSNLSAKRIRYLGGEAHDHKYLWQVLCREWLQEKGIQPNPGTLPGGKPTPDKFRQRQNKLEQWNHEIEQLEQEAKHYCTQIGFRVT